MSKDEEGPSSPDQPKKQWNHAKQVFNFFLKAIFSIVEVLQVVI